MITAATGIAVGAGKVDERYLHAAAYTADVKAQTIEIKINRLSAEISALEIQRTLVLTSPQLPKQAKEQVVHDLNQQLGVKRAELERLRNALGKTD